ncbi:MAG: hypothetical protein KGL59_09990 [Acidobacteriota bacterium]|nr:hypothetical protein [Acidobacteriota bacterium]
MSTTREQGPHFDIPRAGKIIAGNAAVARQIPHSSDRNQLQEFAENGFSAPPCFFHRDCGGVAEVEKQGKAICRACASGLSGVEYPLRKPSREPLYSKPEELVLQLEMKEGRRIRGVER